MLRGGKVAKSRDGSSISMGKQSKSRTSAPLPAAPLAAPERPPIVVQAVAIFVVALTVRLVDSGTKDPAGNPVPETELVGSGEGFVAVGGRSLAVTWTKSATDAPLQLTTADGTPVSLAPGVTWVELVPSTGSITVS